MNELSFRIRREEPGDIDRIDYVTRAAFAGAAHSSKTEHFILKALRERGELHLSIVMENEGGHIVGHVAVSPVCIPGFEGHSWYGLGPVSVLPGVQGIGIGAALIKAALKELKGQGAEGCVVLGDPGYYARFGFVRDPGLSYPGVPPEYFQVLSFGERIPVGTVLYSEAFNARG